MKTKPCETCESSPCLPGTVKCNNCREVEARLGEYMKSQKGQDFVRGYPPKLDNWLGWDYEAVLRENDVEVVLAGNYWYTLGWRHGGIGINADNEIIARKSAAIFVSLWLLGVSCSFADNLAHGFAMWLELQEGRHSIELTEDLSNAVIDMDDHGYSEGLGPDTEESSLAWDKLIEAAQRISGRKAVCERGDE